MTQVKLLMSLRCIVLSISIGLFFLPQTIFAQSIDTIKFSEHLKKNNLFQEQIVFNKKLQKTHSTNLLYKDSMSIELALLYHQLKLADSSKKALSVISSQSIYSNRFNQLYVDLLIVNKSYNVAETTLKNSAIKYSISQFKMDSELALKMLNRNLSKTDTMYNLFTVSPFMFDIQQRYVSYKHRSPALAGIYSAVVPGLGKWYAGYKYQALSAFVSTVLLGGQALESYLRAGIKSPRFIITASLFSIFYTGNIIGSITAVKKKKKDFYKQLDYEIYNYYSTDINTLYN